MNNISIDFFSDTNTGIPLAMRQCMLDAKVGNEAAGEDSTVNKLLEEACEILGKEAAIFLPSGTMCNVIAYKAHIRFPGDYIILDETSHPLVVQSGLIAGLVNASYIPIKGNRGVFTAEQISDLVQAPIMRNIPRARVVSLEQTTNFGGGAIWPLSNIQDISQLCKKHSVSTHLDGARLFNAHVATKIPLIEYCQYFDSVFIDFTKGLGAPMGAILAGNKDFIEKCWYYKFQLGGGMHQVGILAAACIFGLKNHISRLGEDHEKARLLATLLSQLEEIEIDPSLFETNIVYFSLKGNLNLSTNSFTEALARYGIRMLAFKDRIRAITHMGISEEDIYQTAATIKKVLKG